MLPLVALYILLQYLRGTSLLTKLGVVVLLLAAYGLLWLLGDDASPLHEILKYHPETP